MYNLVHKFDSSPHSSVYNNVGQSHSHTDIHMDVLNAMARTVPANPIITNSLILKPMCGVLDQGNVADCGPSALVVMVSLASNGQINDTCRLYTYYITQGLDADNPTTDNGVTVASLMKSVKLFSVCPEINLPYTADNMVTPFAPPPLTCYTNTYRIANVLYSSILQDTNLWSNIQSVIQATGKKTILRGICVGIKVYYSFPTDSSSSGIVPLPDPSKEMLLGGHCVAIVGYATINGGDYVVFQNSWGINWGDHGLGYLPLAYLLDENLSEPITLLSFSTTTTFHFKKNT